jgi:hypothetical protein
MRGEILRHASRESCILSTRLLCHVYRELGYSAMPICVGATALNARALELIRSGRSDECATDPDSFGITIRHEYVEDPPEDGMFPGHVAVVVGDYFADPSADQMARPEHKLFVEPILASFRDGEQGTILDFIDGSVEPTCTLPDGGMVSYRAFADDTSYYTSGDWRNMHPGDVLYERILDTTLGLVEAVRDSDELPPLPPLPRSHSSYDGATPEAIEDGLRSARELGEEVPPALLRAALAAQGGAARAKQGEGSADAAAGLFR